MKNLTKIIYLIKRIYTSKSLIYCNIKLESSVMSCFYVKTIKLGASLTLLTALLQLTNKQHICFYSDLRRKLEHLNKSYDIALIYIPLNHIILRDIQDLFFKSIFYRKYSSLHTFNYNLNSPEDMLNYIKCLIDEYIIISESGSIYNIELLNANHNQYYKSYIENFSKLDLIENKDYNVSQYKKYVNPLYTFNITTCYTLLTCNLNQIHKACIFIPYFPILKKLIQFEI